jgi:hypothetical protein
MSPEISERSFEETIEYGLPRRVSMLMRKT